MWLLSVGTADVGRRNAFQETETNRRRHRFGHVGQHLPMRNISTHPPRHPPRGRCLRRRHMAKTLNRRIFLKVSAAGGALLVGGYIPGLREAGTAEAASVFEPNVWVKIG